MDVILAFLQIIFLITVLVFPIVSITFSISYPIKQFVYFSKDCDAYFSFEELKNIYPISKKKWIFDEYKIEFRMGHYCNEYKKIGFKSFIDIIKYDIFLLSKVKKQKRENEKVEKKKKKIEENKVALENADEILHEVQSDIDIMVKKIESEKKKQLEKIEIERGNLINQYSKYNKLYSDMLLDFEKEE